MSKLIEELSTVPEWNTIGKIIKDEFAKMESDELDNLDQARIGEILSFYEDDCIELVARLVMFKVREEWRKEGQDDFDKFIDKLKSAHKNPGETIKEFENWMGTQCEQLV